MGRRLTGVLVVVAICAALAGCGGNGSATTTTRSLYYGKGACVTSTTAPRCANDRHQKTATTGGFLANAVWQPPPWVEPSLLLTRMLSNGQWHVSGPTTAAPTTHGSAAIRFCGSLYDPALHRVVTTRCQAGP
jgi:hypothetical protein